MANEGDLSGVTSSSFWYLAFLLEVKEPHDPDIPCSKLVSLLFLMNSDIDTFIPNLDGTTNHLRDISKRQEYEYR